MKIIKVVTVHVPSYAIAAALAMHGATRHAVNALKRPATRATARSSTCVVRARGVLDALRLARNALRRPRDHSVGLLRPGLSGRSGRDNPFQTNGTGAK